MKNTKTAPSISVFLPLHRLETKQITTSIELIKRLERKRHNQEKEGWGREGKHVLIATHYIDEKSVTQFWPPYGTTYVVYDTV